MKLELIAETILDEASTLGQLRRALEDFSALCSYAGGVEPNRSFDAWAEDSLLRSGVAINSQAAAHCVTDYRRTVVFLRGIHAALTMALEQFPGVPLKVLYAGCGPYGTLLLPLLQRFDPVGLDLTLLDYHPESLESVARLIEFFGYENYQINLQQGDACEYQHPEPLHLVIAELMQKALEQEPQFAVTANLAPQMCRDGVFIPQRIEVQLCLGSWAKERAVFKRDGMVDTASLEEAGSRVPLGTVFTLVPQQAAPLEKTAVNNRLTGTKELLSKPIEVPMLSNIEDFDVLLLTRIWVFDQHHLTDYEAEITLPSYCSDLAHVNAGDCIHVSYELGGYPKFKVENAGGSPMA